MGVDVSKGWIAVPGVRENAPRTLAEQMLGLDAALEAARGKTVLDLGCAEGLIAAEFVRAVAKRVIGVEILEHHLGVAREVCSGVELVQANLNTATPENWKAWESDIVLALSVLHKLKDPVAGIRNFATAARELIVFRWPNWYNRYGEALHAKYDQMASVEVRNEMTRLGFERERWLDLGPRHEPLDYWRRRDRL